MERSQSPSERLRRSLRELAQADAAELIAPARKRARARAEKLLEDALVQEILEAAGRLQAAGASARAAEAHPTPDADQPAEQAWWAYCVLSAQDSPKVPPGLEGIETGTTVEVLADGELAALVSAVPASDYDDVRLREHLEDLGWVERTARRHEAVLEQALTSVSIVPLRLCTLYRDRDGVRRLLNEHSQVLRESLDKVEGCAEWGVKVFAAPPADRASVEHEEPIASGADESQPAAERPGQPAAERPGATYLLRRQRERESAEQASELRARCAEEVHHRVSALAREALSNPPQRPELHGREMAMLLNGAYLVADQRTDDLDQLVKALQAEWEPRGFMIELTGPWPAYNFVSGAGGVMA